MITFIDEPEHRLDAYLDGLLEGEGLVEFKRDLAASPALRAEVARQRRIDAVLRRTFAAPRVDVAALPPAVRDHILPAAPTSPGRRILRMPLVRRLAAAAAIAGVVLSAWIALQLLRPASSLYEPPPWKSLAALYQDKIADGGRPDWVCDDDAEFRRAFLGQYGQALQLEPLPEGVVAAGLCYANTISERTMMVLARVEDRPVIVFVDRLDHDAGQSLPPDAGLHLHRAVVGRLVLYEVSPLERPALLEHFFVPEPERREEGPAKE